VSARDLSDSAESLHFYLHLDKSELEKRYSEILQAGEL
jgi:hypothetical protein